METLYQNSNRLTEAVKFSFVRYLYKEIDWNNRLIGITGPRGTGKTTLLLQHIKMQFPDRKKALYISLDNIWFVKNTLLELANQFYVYGGTHLFIDEVHRYPNWSIEIKNIYDSFPDLHIIFTGSSILEIYKSNADLSRRAISYHLYGLSFREFLSLENNLNIAPVAFSEILDNHQNIAPEIASKIKILPEFVKYLEYGYYPFYKEDLRGYPARLQNVVNTILENDLPAVENIEYASILKIKKMLMIITSLVPFSPNISKLSQEIETNRNSAMKYLNYLQKAGLINLLLSSQKGMSLMNKPEKIYLDNTNLLYSLASGGVNAGTARETFAANQLGIINQLTIPKTGDFLVNDQYTFEIGGKSKGYEQIKDIPDSFVAIDTAETGYGNKIPLWMLGFTY